MGGGAGDDRPPSHGTHTHTPRLASFGCRVFQCPERRSHSQLEVHTPTDRVSESDRPALQWVGSLVSCATIRTSARSSLAGGLGGSAPGPSSPASSCLVE